MSSYQLMTLRIRKQCRQVIQKPVDNIFVSIKSEREIHFCLHGLEAPYEGGFYHGVLQLPQNYPFSAPKFKFFTNNGRFEAGKYVCTTFTSYHQQAWSSIWTIRTILTAILSFFLSQQTGYGTLQQNDNKRKVLANISLSSNLQNKQFYELFAQKLKQQGINHHKLDNHNEQSVEVNMIDVNRMINDQIQSQENIESVMLPQINNQIRNPNNNKWIIRLLYAVLIIVVLALVFNF